MFMHMRFDQTMAIYRMTLLSLYRIFYILILIDNFAIMKNCILIMENLIFLC